MVSDFCSKTAGIFELVGNILKIFLLFIPLIIIIYVTFDIFKTITSKEEKDLSKAVKRGIFRVIAAILIFFLPTIVNLIYGTIGVEESGCLKCMLDTKTCNSIKAHSNLRGDSNGINSNEVECTVENEQCISNAIFNG